MIVRMITASYKQSESDILACFSAFFLIIQKTTSYQKNPLNNVLSFSID